MMKESPIKIDPLLEPLLVEKSEEQADELVSQLITAHAEPVIRGVIRFKVRLNSYRETQRAESDDNHQEAVLQLVAQLQRFRKLPEANPISDVRGMAAVIAHRICARWMRRQFPERHVFKNRLHYLLTRQRGFAVWQDDDGKQVAGFDAWQEQQKRRAGLEVEKLPAHLRTFKTSKPQGLAQAVAAIFNHLGGPVEFDELVSALATIVGISDQPIETLADDEESAPEVARVPGTGCTVDPTAIDWLSLSKHRTAGSGIFASVTFIQRVNTTGGLAPSAPGESDGEVKEIPYTADITSTVPRTPTAINDSSSHNDKRSETFASLSP